MDLHKPNRPWIVAHRGSMRERPENTRLAFDLALQAPIDGIEFDVQMSVDGTCVIHHDEDLRRVAGVDRRISRMPAAELAELDVGASFAPEFAGERILTLADMLAAYGRRTRLLVEIKSFAPEKKSGHIERLTDAVACALAGADGIDAFVLCFDPGVLEHLAAHHPSVRCVLNTNQPGEVMRQRYGSDYLHAYSTQIRKADASFVAFTRELGKTSMVWSCNSAAEVNKALDLGIDVIMSDRPAWIVQYLRDEAGWSFEGSAA